MEAFKLALGTVQFQAHNILLQSLYLLQIPSIITAQLLGYSSGRE